jgi:hypothetical protein
VDRIKRAVTFSDDPPEKVQLVSNIFVRGDAETYLRRRASVS